MTVESSIYTCDSCGTEGLTPEQVATVTLSSPAIEGGHGVKHLCRAACEEQFMMGEVTGADLFLED